MRNKITWTIISFVIIALLIGIYLYQSKKNHTSQTLSTVTSSVAKRLYNPEGNVVAGNPNGKVTMVEFFGYNCEFCRKYFDLEQAFIKSHPDLRVVFKEYLVFGNISKEPAYAALASNLQGKYLAMHDAMMSSKGVLKKIDIIQIAKRLNLDVSKLLQDMQSVKIKKQIQKNNALTKQLGIKGAPTVLFIKTSDAKSPILSGEVKPYILTGNFSIKVLDKLYNEVASNE